MLLFILCWKDGFVNDPTDRDGATNKGVTITTRRQVGYYKDGDEDIDVNDLELSTDENARGRVLVPYYWNRWKADTINDQKIADILVNWVWAPGSYGIKIPQRLLSVDVDGIIGPKTIEVVNFAGPESLFLVVYDGRMRFINNIVGRSVSGREKKIG